MLPYVLVRPRQWERDPAAVREAVEALGLPGLRQARPGRIELRDQPSRQRLTGLDAAIEEARRFDPKVIVEAAAVDAREVEIGVLQGLDGGDPRPVPSPRSRWRRARVLRLRGEVPRAELPHPRLAQRGRRRAGADLAVRAFEALDVEGLARVDFFVLADDRVVVNEVETMPGFTATSMFPLLWQESGLTYPELVERLVQLALDRETGLR